MLQPEIVEKPWLLVAGFEASFIHALSPEATNFKVIPPLWDKFAHQQHAVPDRAGEASYGVIYGRPESERSHPDELQYIAGVAVNAGADLPDAIVLHTIEPHLFAVFTHRGRIDKIGETCEEIYRRWLPASDYEHAGVADVELYDDRFQFDREDSEMEYWITIRSKSADD